MISFLFQIGFFLAQEKKIFQWYWWWCFWNWSLLSRLTLISFVTQGFVINISWKIYSKLDYRVWKWWIWKCWSWNNMEIQCKVTDLHKICDLRTWFPVTLTNKKFCLPGTFGSRELSYKCLLSIWSSLEPSKRLDWWQTVPWSTNG